MSLPFFQTRFIRKFIQLFAEDFCSSIKNGTKNLAYAYDRPYELFQDFRRLFIEVFGSSQDFDCDHKTYLQVRKRIGTEARDYWYEEVEAIIPGLRYRLPYSIPANPKKINDTYFDNKLFENAQTRDQKVLTRRLNDWSDITQRKDIPDLYTSKPDSDNDIVYDWLGYVISNFSLSPDHNEKVEKRRQRQRQIENEIDYEIGRQQDEQLANYLQELEDNQGRTARSDYDYNKKVEYSNRDDEFIDPDCFLV